ncbi:hypothetical protein VNO80_17655 [Phaseolus coccineus]|uniref:Uncharacterized protein n=1 Tax=Phaseolus coccineus TaxID=3886 RepID=A0AAN9QYR8_PHACN
MRTWESEMKTLAVAKVQRSGSFHQFMNVALESKRERERLALCYVFMVVPAALGCCCVKKLKVRVGHQHVRRQRLFRVDGATPHHSATLMPSSSNSFNTFWVPTPHSDPFHLYFLLTRPVYHPSAPS